MKKPLFVFLTGASGAGKTYLAGALEKHLGESAHVAYFDSLGVPPFEQMVAEYGSGESWQEATTNQWVERLSAMDKELVVLEGQYHPQFAVDACARHEIDNFLLLIVHADRAVRDHRLVVNRAQSDLANDQMDNWANILRNKTLELGGKVIDTTEGNLGKNVQDILNMIAGMRLAPVGSAP